MTDAPRSPKETALQLAIVSGGTHAEVLERAKAYHSYLTGGDSAAAPKPGSTAAAPKSTGAQGAAQGGGKPAETTAPKATPAAGTKPTAAAKPGAATPKATTAAAKPVAAGAAPKGDTKDPKGNNTYDDVVAALQKVMRSVPGDNDKRDKGRKLAYDTLAAAGGGVKGVRDLKPALYDAVVTACEAAAKAAAKPKAAAAPATPPAGDFEEEPVAEDETGDPVEETGGGLAAEDGQGTPMEGEDI